MINVFQDKTITKNKKIAKTKSVTALRIQQTSDARVTHDFKKTKLVGESFMSMRLVIKDLLYGTEKNSGLKFLLFCAMFMVIIFRDTRELLMINVLH